MSIAKLVIIFVTFALLAFLTTIAIYLGAFKSVELVESSLPSKTLIYKLHIGAYHKINDEINKVEKWAKENNIDCKVTFGEYLSDPQKVDEAHLRSHAGCVTQKLPHFELPKDFESRTVSFIKTVEAKFDGSPAIGPFKVYPKMMDYLSEHNYPQPESVFEFYEVSGKDMKTTYVFPLEFGEKNE